MSYRTQALMADDYDIHRRAAACAAAVGIKDPFNWALKNAWALSALPGWDAAYESAILVGNNSPGNTTNVVTDAMILSGVTHLMILEAAANVPASETPAPLAVEPAA